MPKARGAGIDGAVRAQRVAAMASRRKRRVEGAPRQEPFARAFADALRDILVDEMRPIG